MKSLLFVNYEYPPIGGGAANATYYFALNAALQRNRVTLLTSAFKKKRGRTVENGITVYRIPAFRSSAGKSSILQMIAYVISALLHLPSVMRSERPEAAVVFFTFPCGFVGLAVKLVWHIPYLLMLRGGDVPGADPSLQHLHTWLTGIRRIIYRKSGAIAANSRSLRVLAQRADPWYRIDVIINGVDTDFFKPAETAVDSSIDYTFLFVGRFCRLKNIATLLDAFCVVHTLHDGCRLVLIGEGPEERVLRMLVERCGIGNYVQWVGWLPKEQLREYYRSSHCFVNPSFSEGMSNAVLEAMSCGLPIIASNCDGNRELVIDGENGYLCNPKAPETFSARMNELINNNKLSRRMGARGRSLCHDRFSWKSVTGELLHIINTLETVDETI